MPFRSAALTLLYLILLPLSAAAQDVGAELEAEARARFALGELYYSQARFADAATEFEAAYAAHPHPTLLHNIYLARRDQGDVPAAIDALSRYLTAATDLAATERRLLEGRLAAMQRQIASAEHSGPTEATAPTETDPPDRPEEPTEATTEADASALARPTPPPPRDEGPMIGAVVALSTAGAAALAMAITGPLALVERGNLATTCAPTCTDDQVSGARTLGITTDVLLGVGLTAAAAGVVLLIVASTGGNEASVVAAPVVTNESVGVVVGGHF